MTFPTAPSVVFSQTTAPANNHTVNLPGGIQAGHLLVAVWANRFQSAATFPAGWTKVYERLDANDSFRHIIATRIADGTEGASITVTTDGNARNSAAHVYRILGHGGFTSPGNGFNGGTTAPTFPELDHGQGSVDTLWLASVAFDAGELTGFPSGYFWDQNQSTAGSQNVRLASGRLAKTGQTETPGSATASVSTRFISQTSAVLPVSAEGIQRVVGSVVTGSLVDSV